MNILDEIFAHKKVEVAARKRENPLKEVRSAAEGSASPPDFVRAIRNAQVAPALIAEVKFASPSKGILVKDEDPVGLARIYARNGASAISVLTDEKFFHGKLEYLERIHTALPTVPLLRKDFICDPYQVYEASAAGASAILLIAAYLDIKLMADLHALALALGLIPLVEVHNLDELETIRKLAGLKLLGVNNRNLTTFEVDLQTCLDLRPLVSTDVCFVAESGIHLVADVSLLSAAGVDAMLIGEALVTAPDIAEKIQRLSGREKKPRIPTPERFEYAFEKH